MNISFLLEIPLNALDLIPWRINHDQTDLTVYKCAQQCHSEDFKLEFQLNIG